MASDGIFNYNFRISSEEAEDIIRYVSSDVVHMRIFGESGILHEKMTPMDGSQYWSNAIGESDIEEYEGELLNPSEIEAEGDDFEFDPVDITVTFSSPYSDGEGDMSYSMEIPVESENGHLSATSTRSFCQPENPRDLGEIAEMFNVVGHEEAADAFELIRENTLDQYKIDILR